MQAYAGHPAMLQEPIFMGEGTGSAPDFCDLRSKVRILEEENQTLKKEKESLEYQLSQVTTEMQNMRISCDGPDMSVDAEKHQEDISEEAIRKRLERLCKRNSQGILGSNLFVHTMHMLHE